MKLSKLLENVEISEMSAEKDCEILQISSDSRNILKGGLFICIKGVSRDGHDYISDAVSRGASVVIIENEDRIPQGVPYVLVKDTRIAEAFIWDNKYAHPADGMKVIAVTGTNGKTSTAFMLRKIFMKAGYRVGVITTVKAMVEDRILGTFGGSSIADAYSAMTTPDPEYLYGTVYMMKEFGAEVLILEASSHALLQQKLVPLKIDAGVFTNLTEEHLDFHGSMESYFEAKALLGKLSQKLIINLDDKYMSRLKYMFPEKCVSCSVDEKNPLYRKANVSAIKKARYGVDGIGYIYFSEGAVFEVRTAIPGEFTFYNTLLALSTAIELGVPPEIARDGIGELNSIEGRLQRLQLDNCDFSVYIDYAHTPAALENLVKTVRDFNPHTSKIILLFGCGGDRDRTKRAKMGSVASALADFVIISSDNSRSENTDAIISDILKGVDKEKPYKVLKNRREAIEYALTIASMGDSVILAGKGHEKYEIDSYGKHPFDEEQIVKDFIKQNKKT